VGSDEGGDADSDVDGDVDGLGTVTFAWSVDEEQATSSADTTTAIGAMMRFISFASLLSSRWLHPKVTAATGAKL
jgi:hypothetical protein